jgi:hypothetical protein
MLVRLAENSFHQTRGRLRRKVDRVALVEFSGPVGEVPLASKLTPS